MYTLIHISIHTLIYSYTYYFIVSLIGVRAPTHLFLFFHYWSTTDPLLPTSGPHHWSPLLVTTTGHHHWSPSLVTTTGHDYWSRLLVTTTGRFHFWDFQTHISHRHWSPPLLTTTAHCYTDECLFQFSLFWLIWKRPCHVTWIWVGGAWD